MKPLSLLHSRITPLLGALTVCFLFNPTVADAAPKPGIKWSDDVGVLSKKEFEKPVLLRFSAEWCGPCQIMDARVWPDAKVATMVGQRYLPVEVDIDNPAVGSVMDKYKINVVPTIVVLDRKGREIARTHFMTAEQTMAFLKNPSASSK